MGNRNGIVVAALFGMLHVPLVQAGDRWSGEGAYYAYARVTDVQPIVRVVEVTTPREACWDEPVRYQAHGRGGHRSFTPAVLGGILGGVVGNQFGGGRGQDVMTIAGAFLQSVRKR